LTVSPSAGPTNSVPEEFSVEPHQSAGNEQGSSPSPPPGPPVEPEEEAADAPRTKPLPKVNAVAQEVRVKATGARAGTVSVERELFSESTTTVLVFEKGGVIRLAAAVVPGQLLFLSNEESKREVVAQVIRKRAFRPTECYVELEFTEPAPGFWGMEFSAATALLPKDAKEIAAAEMVASAETTADELEEAAPPPSADEVLALKKEVEALRTQLKLLQTQPEPEQPPLAARIPDAPSTPPAAPAPPPEAPAALAVEPAPSFGFPSKSLPIDREPEPVWMAAPSQRLPPKPAMDFRVSMPKRKRSFRARGQFTPGFRTGMLRVTFLSATLAALIGVVWYKHWLPWMHEVPKKISVSSWAGGVTAAATIPETRPASAVSMQPDASATKAGSGAPVSPNGASPNMVSAGAAYGEAEGPPSVPYEVKPQPAIKEKPKPRLSIAKRAPDRTSLPAKAADSVPAAVGQPALVPPKLIRSERAVVSLDDLRDFETGSVIIDAVVDTSGMVQSMNVLSGPPSLRKPALEALKDYRYIPATVNGKPVPAHVTVKIQFHFEP
jgi:Gram-negative bacterial TonB protein C-terminal